MSAESKPIKVLIVDDSAIVRKILSETIAGQSDMQVVGTAPDPLYRARKILSLHPDVLTLDIEMPRMDGLTFLKKTDALSSHARRGHQLPRTSSCEASLEALRCGAVEVLAKPGGPYSIGELSNSLPAKLRAAANARLRHCAAAPPDSAPRPSFASTRFHENTIIAVGASTGGTEAIREILVQLPATTPGIVVTQHIPPMFSAAFAQRLNQLCAIEVKEARDGDEVRAGLALIAPGNFHMILRKTGPRYFVQVQDGPQVCYQRPSVDVMFASVARPPERAPSVSCSPAWAPMEHKAVTNERGGAAPSPRTRSLAWSTACRGRQSGSVPSIRSCPSPRLLARCLPACPPPPSADLAPFGLSPETVAVAAPIRPNGRTRDAQG